MYFVLRLREPSYLAVIFPLGQNNWQRFQELGLSQRYNDEEEFVKKIESLMALAFVPEPDVVDLYEQLIAGLEHRDLDLLIDCFEDI